ncbi:MAG: elongation factor P maturation arginine rhamnosyltransferase EarP [Burkholderiales bacterium]|nr:elongation factor P maturation arginine rhamnosyltransferase EarP [Burkholderiales bacterium]
MPTYTCDIFCDVIDNYGDAGICWRLSRDLVKSRGWSIRLFINNLQTLSELVPSVSPHLASQNVDGIEIEMWDHSQKAEPSQIVIETFGCRIPESFEKKIARSPLKPVWINLEYLSAEDWIEGFHCLPSLHPQLGYEKFFFYPGVTKRTGGMIIENDLIGRQKDFEKDKEKFLLSLNADPGSEFNFFVFCYPYSHLNLLKDALIADGRPVQLLLAAGKASDELEKLLVEVSTSIKVVRLPMIAQSHFDELLWSCNTLIVRGEDSFTRAQLSAVPFIWTPYAQEQSIHLGKLKAFCEKYRKFEPDDSIGNLWESINFSWNQGLPEFVPLWAKWRNNLSVLEKWAETWRNHLFSLQSLTINLCNFIEEKIKSPD